MWIIWQFAIEPTIASARGGGQIPHRDMNGFPLLASSACTTGRDLPGRTHKNLNVDPGVLEGIYGLILAMLVGNIVGGMGLFALPIPGPRGVLAVLPDKLHLGIT